MIEPGLITVFRLYAILRVALVALGMGWQSFSPIYRLRGEPTTLERPYGVLVLILALLLVAYLYADTFRTKLGRFYLPIGLVFASASLFLEQYRYASPSFLWQPDSFLFILLILAAWQYGMRGVGAFILGMIGFELAFTRVFPPTIISFIPGNVYRVENSFGGQAVSSNFRYIVVGGRLLARSLSFGVIGFVVARLVAAQRQQHEELAAANLRLREHAATLEQLATSRERNRLSRELHDTLAHTLSGLTVQLEAMRTAWKRIPAKADAMLEQMLTITRHGLEETRRALKNLRAAPLEELGLALAIQTLAEDVCQRNNLGLHLDIPTTSFDVPVEVQQSFYRVAQEALENIVRHADAHEVELDLQYSRQGRLELRVRDDGRGFNHNQVDAKERLGLQLMRERAHLIHADFQVDSHPGQGTTITMGV